MSIRAVGSATAAPSCDHRRASSTEALTKHGQRLPASALTRRAPACGAACVASRLPGREGQRRGVRWRQRRSDSSPSERAFCGARAACGCICGTGDAFMSGPFAIVICARESRRASTRPRKTDAPVQGHRATWPPASAYWRPSFAQRPPAVGRRPWDGWCTWAETTVGCPGSRVVQRRMPCDPVQVSRPRAPTAAVRPAKSRTATPGTAPSGRRLAAAWRRCEVTPAAAAG
jgi:hypothetical protein